MLKELSAYDALYKLFQDKNCFMAYLSNYDKGDMVHTLVSGVDLIYDLEEGAFISVGGHRYLYCWIEVPYEYQAYDNLERPCINIGDKLIGRREYNEGEHLVVSIISKKDKGYRTMVDGSWQTNTKLFNDYTRADGTPIGKLKTNNNKQVDMVFVEGGTFQMGSNSGASDEKPVHSVTLSSFYIGKYPLTQKQWTEVMGSNPAYFQGDNLPVESISWYQAVEFCNKLSEKEGLTPVYDIKETTVTCNWKANGYRLPTEAEWEFAAKGGNESKNFTYAGSDNIDEVAWYNSNSNKTQPVGTKKANELGIYDMSGNTWEWCWDWYSSYSSDAKTNPHGSDNGYYRVLRGGGWISYAKRCRSAYHSYDFPDYSDDYCGFRVARNF